MLPCDRPKKGVLNVLAPDEAFTVYPLAVEQGPAAVLHLVDLAAVFTSRPLCAILAVKHAR
jgi:hypothetical protein